MNKRFYKVIAFMLKHFMRLFFPYEVHGKENIKKLSKGYILCSNHLSCWDPVFFLAIHPDPIHFMAKSELFKNKLLAVLLSKLGVFPVKRGKGDKEAIGHALELSLSGEILGIFVEGTRSKTGDFLRPRSGAALLASKTNSDVLPVCITGTSSDNKVRIFRKTIISYGNPLKFEKVFAENGSRGAIKESTNMIMDSIKELR